MPSTLRRFAPQIGLTVLALVILAIVAVVMAPKTSSSSSNKAAPHVLTWANEGISDIYTLDPARGPAAKTPTSFEGEVSGSEPIDAQEQQALARHGGTVLGITYQDDSGASELFVRQEHITYPVLRDVTGNFTQPWGVNGVPETFVINRQGRIVAMRRFQLAGNWLRQTVAPLLAQAS